MKTKFPDVTLKCWMFDCVCPKCKKKHILVITPDDKITNDSDLSIGSFTCCNKAWYVRLRNDVDFLIMDRQ